MPITYLMLVSYEIFGLLDLFREDNGIHRFWTIKAIIGKKARPPKNFSETNSLIANPIMKLHAFLEMHLGSSFRRTIKS